MNYSAELVILVIFQTRMQPTTSQTKSLQSQKELVTNQHSYSVILSLSSYMIVLIVQRFHYMGTSLESQLCLSVICPLPKGNIGTMQLTNHVQILYSVTKSNIGSLIDGNIGGNVGLPFWTASDTLVHVWSIVFKNEGK